MVGRRLTYSELGPHLGAMLFVPSIFDLDGQCGTWTREQLSQMNDRFVAAMELAFAKGLESRAAAAAIYSRNAMNGKQYTEAVIEAAWRYLLINMDEGKDVTFAAIVARCPGVAPDRVREGIKRRLTSWIGEVQL